MKVKLIGLVLALVLILSACDSVPSLPILGGEEQPVVTEATTEAPATELAATEAPVATEVPTEVPTEAPPASPTCVLDTFAKDARFGVQLKVDQKPSSDWEFDPTKAARIPGDTHHPELAADADLSGCVFIIEGRKVLEERHDIWILMPDLSQYLDSDGKFRAKEMSVWAYPTSWNNENFADKVHLPIALYFARDKRNNQLANGYDWDIYVHVSSGNELKFSAGGKIEGVPEVDHCSQLEPARINVTGVYDPAANNFTASIGAEKCWTAAKIDGVWTKWFGVKDNILFTEVEAWGMPNWTESQVADWIATQQ